MEEEKINVEGVSADVAGGSKAPETPMANARHFRPGPKRSGDEQFENNPGIVRQDDDGFDAGLETIHSCGDAPYNLDDRPAAIDPGFPDIMGFDDEAMPESDAMMSALIAAGTSAEAASNFVNRITENQNAARFMEMHGQRSLVAEANKQRRSPNVEGLRQFDLCTNKPDGTLWNFSVRANR